MAPAYRFLLMLRNGEAADPPAFLTEQPDWQPGDVFVAANGRAFRIVDTDTEIEVAGHGPLRRDLDGRARQKVLVEERFHNDASERYRNVSLRGRARWDHPVRMMRVVLVESRHKARKDESPTRDYGDLRRDELT